MAATDRHSLRTILFGTLAGKILLVSAALKVVLPAVGGGAQRVSIQLLNGAATVGLIFALGYFLARLLAVVRRRLLWRVRRKLILSYVFIGFVPVLLVGAFVLLAGVMLFLNVSAYLVKSGFDDVGDEASLLAETAAAEIGRDATLSEGRSILERKRAVSGDRYPDVALALVPRSAASRVDPIAVGMWDHAAPPIALPPWVERKGFAGLLAYRTGTGDETDLVVRAVSRPDERDPSYAVIVDLPVGGTVLGRLRETTGIGLGQASVVPIDGDASVSANLARPARTTRSSSATPQAQVGLGWVTFFDFTDWKSGRTGKLSIPIYVRLSDIYARIAGAQAELGSVNLGQVVLLILGIIGVLFLIIEVGALAMGFALARSITGSVHELFVGTARVRQGDFSHRIRVRSRDQLGELAESFNAMTKSIEDLLQQAAEKRRLEEELRIARQIQMSLLPAGPLHVPGISVTTLCVPAREVGGDYYDFFPLGEGRLGILIADVSGKGTSAALYMAELKGLMLSLSAIHESPKQLLVEVNRVLSAHLDSRSFVTMMYAVVDLGRKTLIYARAGHTPLIYMPAADARGGVQILAPDGLVVGLRLDGFASKFERMLVESCLPIATGDVLVFFTDGVTEAMNEHADMFGESRLSRLVESHCHLEAEALRDRILGEVEAFVGRAEQHDDMTMILLKIGDVPAVSPYEVAAQAAI